MVVKDLMPESFPKNVELENNCINEEGEAQGRPALAPDEGHEKSEAN